MQYQSNDNEKRVVITLINFIIPINMVCKSTNMECAESFVRIGTLLFLFYENDL